MASAASSRWAFCPISAKFNVQTPLAPSETKRRKIPIRKPKSPTRLTMKAFLPGVGGRILLIPEPDQEVGTEAHPFPPDEHEQEVVSRDQKEHHEDEEVQVDEEPPEAGIVVHVADRVDMDEKPHPGDHQAHDDGEGVEPKTDGDPEFTRGDPGVEFPLEHPRRRGQLEKLIKNGGRGEEGEEQGQAGDPGD